MDELQKDYPWTQTPLIIGAPMRLISLAHLAVEVSRAGGLGFIGAGTHPDLLPSLLHTARSLLAADPIPSSKPYDVLPIGIGVITWGASLATVLSALTSTSDNNDDPIPPPAAIWLFAPHHSHELAPWAHAVRRATHGKTKIWVQVGSVREAEAVVRAARPDVLVVQGGDAGGHGLNHGAGIVPLVPEVQDTVAKLFSSREDEGEQVKREEAGRKVPPVVVAAGGIVEGRGVAAALTLGAAGAVLGTRLLATPEANVAEGYRRAVVRAGDGGMSTRRTGLYDTLRGTTGWPAAYGGRGVLNRSWEDAEAGMEVEENTRLYREAERHLEEKKDGGEEGWREGTGRLTTYAGTGVGLVREVKGAGEIVREVREEAKGILRRVGRARL
ncbi:MAG: hypothetical protein M1821_006368 [Bathelium mastoideum]|nr:MAG: hypothetical protein M1821_006368 [Bathelium mastoideum]